MGVGNRTFAALAMLGVVLSLFPEEGHAAGRRGRGWGAPRLAQGLGSGWYLPVGLNLGVGAPSAVVSNSPDDDFWPVLGVEVSAVHLDARSGNWYGFYADVTAMLPDRAMRLSLGPEGGWFIFGADGGFVAEYSRGAIHPGAQVRGLLSLGYVTFYVSGLYVHDVRTREKREEAQVGLLLKLPFILQRSGSN